MSTQPAVALDERALGDLLAEALARHDVPGAALGVRVGDEQVIVAAGVASVARRTPVTPDTVFQIGSITKPMTATLAMILVDEGRLELDEPIVRRLPEFRVADPDVSRQVSLRNLLSHTSGIGGDYVADTGRGDDALARFVAGCARVGQDYRLGRVMSYCNSGYSIVGRLIEVIEGAAWEDVLRRRLVQPLGLRATTALPEETILSSVAMPHVRTAEGVVPSPAWLLPRALGPTGAVCATVEDVLTFASAHLAGGVAVDGSRILSEESARLMRTPVAEVPDIQSPGLHWGLGWALFGWGFGHDGGAPGQAARLQVAEEAGVSVCLLTNVTMTRGIFDDVVGGLLRRHAAVTPYTPPGLPQTPADVDVLPCVGRFRRHDGEASVELDDAGRLVLTQRAAGDLALLLPPALQVQQSMLVPVGPLAYVARSPDGATDPVVFFDAERGYPQGVSVLGRAFHRIEE